MRDDSNITNTDGSNYWGPRITKAVKDREDDGPALVKYVKGVLRKTGESDGWNALLEADRLDLSFEDMVLNGDEPVRGLFTDEDRGSPRRSSAISARRSTVAASDGRPRQSSTTARSLLTFEEAKKPLESSGRPR